MSEKEDIYDEKFLDKQTLSASAAAPQVLAILFEYFTPSSVVDVGCGRGSWLAAAEKLGSRQLHGIDGPWIKSDDLLSDKIVFTQADIEQPLRIAERFDLCMSIEVAEHLEEERAASFINDLCNLSEIVLFSAAIKHQKGEGHINTQWAPYWVDLFASLDYTCYDVIRWRIWDNSNIDWWFRQNMFLFVSNKATSVCRDTLQRDQRPLINVVHPDNYDFVCKVCGYTDTNIKE